MFVVQNGVVQMKHSLAHSGYSETSVPWFPTAASATSIAVPGVHVEVIDNLDALDQIASEWRTLEAKAPASATVFQSFAWCRAWIERYVQLKPIASFKVVTAREDGVLQLVWPLTIYRKHGMNEGRWLGEPMTQYGDVLMAADAPQSALKKAWQFLEQKAGVDFLNLRKIKLDASVRRLEAFQQMVPVRREESVLVDLYGLQSIEEFNARTKSKVRRERGRKRRRLGELGDISFEVLETGPRAIATVKDAIAFKEQWLNERGLTSEAALIGDPFAVLADMAAGNRDAGLVVSRLCVDNEPASIEVGFRWNGGYYAYLGAFNPKLEKYGPGAVQMEDTIAWCISEGLAFYDLFAPADRYKLEWGDDRIPVFDIARACSLRGWMYSEFYLRTVRPMLKDVYTNLPIGARQWVAQTLLAR